MWRLQLGNRWGYAKMSRYLPDQLRGAPLKSGVRPIKWEIVDQLLKQVKWGEMREFAMLTEISFTTLVKRKTKKGIRVNKKRA